MPAKLPASSGVGGVFVDELSKLSRKWRTLFDARVKRIGLTLARARLLRHLAEDEKMTQTELAVLLEIEGPTLVRLLDGLERQNFIRRCPVEGDRRANRISLTEQGRAQAAEVARMATEVRVEILRDISEAELDATVNIFRRINRNIESCR